MQNAAATVGMAGMNPAAALAMAAGGPASAAANILQAHAAATQVSPIFISINLIKSTSM